MDTYINILESIRLLTDNKHLHLTGCEKDDFLYIRAKGILWDLICYSLKTVDKRLGENRKLDFLESYVLKYNKQIFTMLEGIGKGGITYNDDEHYEFMTQYLYACKLVLMEKI